MTRWWGLLGVLWLAGCSQSMNAGMRTIAQSWAPLPVVDLSPVVLDPRRQYLRVQVDGGRGPQVALLVEGDRDPHPDGGVTRVWYGAGGTVLRLYQGRLVGWADAQRTWRVIDEAGWPTDTGAALHAVRHVQVIDQQPGHRLGQRQSREWAPLATAPGGHSLQGPADGLRWFVDRPVPIPGPAPQAEAALGRLAWYAVDPQASPATIVYGQQCLEPHFCLHWQHWPVR